ncbi:uncharacterized protein LOC134233240 isoform X2 [Saccostrea cucullata]|uniref:uncharacterized protein LOC134233240 isoform X2 n=1 Tax=Saccostrea cuccullata TaxID=36930 RepID=UPI002ED4DE8F
MKKIEEDIRKMSVLKTVSQILLSTWLLIHNGDISSTSLIMSLNWFEAQLECHKNNDTLPSNTSSASPVMEFWSGLYHRQSLWIKILGCYDSRDIHGYPEIQMIYSSAGFCHEMCISLNSTIFGIKNNKCMCLERPILATSISSTECNETCQKNTEGVQFSECGGPNAYSVYTADAAFSLNLTVTESDKKSACLAINCGMTKTFSVSFACSELNHAVCEEKGYLGCFEDQRERVLSNYIISEELMTVERCRNYCSKKNTKFYGVAFRRECFCGDVLRTRNRKPESECNMKCSGDANQICGGAWRLNIYRNPYNEIDMDAQQNWTESMKWCKTWTQPTYLYGNISSTNASLTCKALQRTRAGLSWLGIAKEVYIGYDQGVPVDDDQRGSFIQCQKCNQTSCVFVDCFIKLNNVLCNKV